MTERINVEPTPIQRNTNDVAIELLNIHLSRTSVSIEELSSVFAQYFALATILRKKSINDLKAFLPDEIKNKL